MDISHHVQLWKELWLSMICSLSWQCFHNTGNMSLYCDTTVTNDIMDLRIMIKYDMFSILAMFPQHW